MTPSATPVRRACATGYLSALHVGQAGRILDYRRRTGRWPQQDRRDGSGWGGMRTVHGRDGVHCAINVKAGEGWRNERNQEEVERFRDWMAIRSFGRPESRRWQSRWFRRRFAHLEKERWS